MNSSNNQLFLGLAGVLTVVVIMLFFMILDNGEAEGIKNDPIGYLHGNSIYALEHTHIIEGKLFGAIHNISDEPLFVQGEWIKIFNHQGRQIDYFFHENPMTIQAGGYGYFNTTAPEADFSYYEMALVLQGGT